MELDIIYRAMRVRYITHAITPRPLLSYKRPSLNYLFSQIYTRNLHHLTKVAAQELDHYAKVELEKSISKVCIFIDLRPDNLVNLLNL